jgi:hypothetical protein
MTSSPSGSWVAPDHSDRSRAELARLDGRQPTLSDGSGYPTTSPEWSFAASDMAAFMTGSTIAVDAGRLA